MRKITKEEAAKLPLQRGSASAVRSSVEVLQPGEILLIDRGDWQQKKGPFYMIRRIEKLMGRKYNCNKIATGEGWVVERMS